MQTYLSTIKALIGLILVCLLAGIISVSVYFYPQISLLWHSFLGWLIKPDIATILALLASLTAIATLIGLLPSSWIKAFKSSPKSSPPSQEKINTDTALPEGNKSAQNINVQGDFITGISLEKYKKGLRKQCKKIKATSQSKIFIKRKR